MKRKKAGVYEMLGIIENMKSTLKALFWHWLWQGPVPYSLHMDYYYIDKKEVRK